MEILEIIANICTVLTFLVSLIVANEAFKISKKINIVNKTDSSNNNKQTALGKNKQEMYVGK